MRIDLHSHSRLSDGTDAPAEVVARARAHGVDVLALTDHDHALGWDEAQQAAVEHGVLLVPGIEISTRHHGRGVHLLAYCPDPTHVPLRNVLAATLRGRQDRLSEWVRRAAAIGLSVDPERVRAQAGGSSALSKNHVADALVESGQIPDRQHAFDTLLGPGMPLHVERSAPSLVEAIGLVSDAGGVSVLAHPWGRESVRVLDEAAFATLAEAGLAGVEVDHGTHTPAQRAALRDIARRLDLVATGSSDYHGLARQDRELGSDTTAEPELRRLLDRAVEAGRRSGRPVPEVLLERGA